MLNAIKLNGSRRHRTSVLGVLCFAVVFGLLPISANAQCSDWSAAGEWRILQADPGGGGFYPIELKLQQQGSVVTGTATRGAYTGKARAGSVAGTLNGSSFSAEIAWSDGGTGVYNAQVVLPSGKLEGKTYEKGSKWGPNPWYSGDGALKCAPPPRPIRSTGKFRPPTRPSANATVQTGQATGSLLKAPTMVASQAIFPTPYTATGFVVLTWDAGPDHPNAEVWVKYGRDRVLFMKQPKGGQQVPVQRGQMYTYVLMDGRNVLGTATFVAH